MKLFEFLWVRNDKICHFEAKPTHWYRYRKCELVPIGQRQSGTGTNASNNPDFFTLALLNPNSYTDSIGTLIND